MQSKTFEVTYDVFSSFEELESADRALLEKAKDAMKTSYSPYSDFMVGCAIELNDGTIVTGSNQENAAYSPTICAERSALMTLASQNRQKDVRKIAVMGTGRTFETSAPVTPCGVCRQVIKEFEDIGKTPIVFLMSGAKGDVYRITGIDSLLPFGFGPKDLNL